MIIKNLSLKNYGAIKSAQLDFQAGWNLISGANGEGKSHIIRSIAYALLNKTFGKVEDDLNWYANDFLVNLQATYQNTDFKVNCAFNSKGGSSKECQIGGNHFTGTQEVNQALKEYFDPTLCSASILSFQGQMDIVTAKDAERREILKKIYNLNFTNEVKKLEQEKEVLEQEKNDLEKEIYALENKTYDIQEFIDLPMTDQEYKETKLKIQEIDNRIVEIDNFQKSLEQVQREFEFLQKKVADYDDQILNLNSQIEEKKNDISREQKLLDETDVESHLQDIKDGIEKLQKREQINSLQTELNNIQLKRVKSFDDSLLESKTEQLYSKRHEVEEAQNMVKLISQGQCPTCGNEFEGVDKNKYVEKIHLLEKEIQSIEKGIDCLKKEKAEIEDETRKQENLKNRKDQLSSQIELQEQTVQNKIQNLEESKQNILSREDFYRKNISLFKEQLENLEKQKSKIQAELDNVRLDLDKKSEELNELKRQVPIVDKKELEHKKGNLQNTVKAYDYAQTQNKIIQENNEKIEQQKKKDERRLQIAKDKSNKVVKEIGQFDEAIKVYKKELPKYIISYLLGDLKKGMNDLLDEAYSGRYHVEMEETKTGLRILYGDKKKEIALSSGAEQNLFNLGFKNAFSYLSGLQILFLDESLNFADDNIARQTFNHLNLKLEKGDLEQIFVITHKPKIKELLEADYGAKVFSVSDGQVTAGEV